MPATPFFRLGPGFRNPVGALIAPVMGALLLTSCGFGQQADAPAGLAFDDEANARRYLATSMVESSLPAETTSPETTSMWTEANPAAICESPDWLGSTETVFAQVGLDVSSVSMTPTGRGCRATLSSDDQKVEVGLEIVGPGAIDEVAAARRNSSSDEPLALMGLVELDLDISDTRVASSLFNSDLDRLEEHRWVVVDDSAFHVLVVVQPGGAALRSVLIDSITEIEDDLAAVVADNAATPAAVSTSEPVVEALAQVIRSVLEGVPLDDVATSAGLEAIAPENAFPENMAAIAAYRDAVFCSGNSDSAECRIEALDSVYRFGFVQEGADWLLDDFSVDG